MESEPLCDLQPRAFEPSDTDLQAYALPATPQQTTYLKLNTYTPRTNKNVSFIQGLVFVSLCLRTYNVCVKF